MWDAAKQEAFDALRHREQQAVLTDEERRTLEELLYELEQEEQRALGPQLDRLSQEQRMLQQECGYVRRQNDALESIAERQADLMARAKSQLSVLLNEQAVLNSELQHALGQSLSDTR